MEPVTMIVVPGFPGGLAIAAFSVRDSAAANIAIDLPRRSAANLSRHVDDVFEWIRAYRSSDPS